MEGFPSCYYHPSLELFLVVYVDDFKMAGPQKNMKEGWKLIRKGIQLEDPKKMDDQGLHFLGCKQSVRTIPINGKKVTTMTYDMEDFLKSCVKNYLELAGLTADKLKHVATPFLPEDHRESQAGAPQPGDNPTTCPWCKHTFQLQGVSGP